jgi:hypothetical protein
MQPVVMPCATPECINTWTKSSSGRGKNSRKYCAECSAKKQRGWQKAWQKAHKDVLNLRWRTRSDIKDKDRRYSHQKRYKEPYENKLQRLKEQDFRCANPGCRTTNPGSRGDCHTDHDHNTGKIRGELCQSCNLALGMLKDDDFRLNGLAEYLRKHRN